MGATVAVPSEAAGVSCKISARGTICLAIFTVALAPSCRGGVTASPSMPLMVVFVVPVKSANTGACSVTCTSESPAAVRGFGLHPSSTPSSEPCSMNPTGAWRFAVLPGASSSSSVSPATLVKARSSSSACLVTNLACSQCNKWLDCITSDTAASTSFRSSIVFCVAASTCTITCLHNSLAAVVASRSDVQSSCMASASWWSSARAL
mmetsp:Transcript_92056/g.231472  ORF Transcript_92056/g.231472 Transcript_92056/m.231472 type:complete len:207 (-) Transcript_92056:852-1472(-)